MFQFFIDADEIMEDGIHIKNPQSVNHIKNVLRMKPGEKIRLCCEAKEKEYTCSIISLDSEEIFAQIEDIDGESRELPCEITLYQGLPKGDKMELIIQKAVEIGASRIVPVATKRSVVKLDEKRAKKKVDRWNLIAESAAKQSKRNRIPQVTSIMTYAMAIEDAKDCSSVLIPYEDARGMSHTREVMESMKGQASIGIFIGPEGGFEDKEVEMVKEIGGHVITLGHRILRTETAGLTTLSILSYLLEED
ncbi:MAG: 16S rRNA (uracil(1498)-N(3))-methyltransferase [Eubacteriales bacterium]|nr:16S rRNA (uracil(1498)-N(3))-methyltransferase [Eubacteriales bacterium]